MKSTHKKGKKQNRKENSKTEGQKATTHNHESKPSSKFLQSKSTLIVSHKNKIAFSGQTKGVRRILKPISDHCVPDVRASLSPLWSPSHRTIEGFQDETKHRGGHLTITFVKSLPKNKIAFSGQTKGARRILKLISDHLVPA